MECSILDEIQLTDQEIKILKVFKDFLAEVYRLHLWRYNALVRKYQQKRTDIKLKMTLSIVKVFSFIFLFISNDCLAAKSITAYVRKGCPHCFRAKEFLQKYHQKHPKVVIEFKDVTKDPQYLNELKLLNKKYHIDHPGVPAFHINNRHFFIGFSDSQSTGKKIIAFLSSEDDLPTRYIALPIFGDVDVKKVGLFTFTAMIGLIDGFNPCAMWVLLFLLSILVYLKDRKKMILISGTFVITSGVVYFFFMSAWFNLYQFLGMARWVQISLGLIALILAGLQIKDFFNFGKGVTLSISSESKKKIAIRARKIVQANSLWLALSLSIALAISVNLVELLCTAGLPAIYTQVLSNYSLSKSSYYGYIALYNVFYMLDDSLMVGIAITTLSHKKLQESSGRYLKLLSGIVIAILGLMLIFRPEWLVWS
ncbi:MAG: glutaredoxin family protein [Bacteriovoracaceae bacterium]|jgi:glutaredoxin|nr:glutaredoxin family protein [Bacteriovoracaceae bacterium]